MIKLLLFPSDYFDKNKIDPELETEFIAASNTGLFEIILFSYDDWFNKGVLKLNKKVWEKARAIYRGWMMTPEKYEKFYGELTKQNVELITTPESYAKMHVFPNIYEDIKVDTPIMQVYRLHEQIPLEQVFSCMERIMVKDYVKSVKGTDFPKFFTKEIGQDEFNQYMDLFYKYRGNLLTGGICIKEYIELKKYDGYSNEYRVFYINNEIASVSRNSGQPYYAEKPPSNLIEKYKGLPSRFYTVDYAELQSGEWKVLETGDGSVSGLSDYQDAEAFFRAIYLGLCK